MTQDFQQHKLKEGQWYDFKIVKSTFFDDEAFYVLETPLKTRMLIPQTPYLDYNFTNNQIILCKVDKVSCTGKIYLEPKHPFYKLNKSYLFPFVDQLKIQNLYGEQIDLVVMKDKLNQLIYLPLWRESATLLPEILLKVIRIKKSKLFALPQDFPFDYKPVDKECLDLTIINAYAIPNDGAYYIFEDFAKRWHLAPMKYFGKMLLPIGFKVRAITSKYRTNSYYHLQFEHPRYIFGTEMCFDILSEKIVEETPNKKQWQISVRIDHEIQNVNLPLSAKVNAPQIMLKVGLIRKGKLQLTKSVLKK